MDIGQGPPAIGDHGAAEFLRDRLGPEQTFGGLGYGVAQAFIQSVRRRQAASGGAPQLATIALSGPAEAIAALGRERSADRMRPLAASGPGLASLPGAPCRALLRASEVTASLSELTRG